VLPGKGMGLLGYRPVRCFRPVQPARCHILRVPNRHQERYDNPLQCTHLPGVAASARFRLTAGNLNGTSDVVHLQESQAGD